MKVERIIESPKYMGSFEKTVHLRSQNHGIQFKVDCPEYTAASTQGQYITLSPAAAYEFGKALIVASEADEAPQPNTAGSWEDIDGGTRRLKVPAGYVYEFNARSSNAYTMLIEDTNGR